MAPYARRLLLAVGLLALAAVVLYLFSQVFRVFLLAFAGTLLALLLDALATQVCRRTPLGRGASLAVVIAGLLALAVGFGWLIGPRIGEQFSQLSERIPQSLEQIEGWLQDTAWGRRLWSDASGNGETGNVLQYLKSIVSATVGGVVNFAIVLVVGIYMAVAPRLYYDNLLRLLPKRRRPRGREVLRATIHALRRWLVGRLAAMVVVGVLITAGLFVVGAPLALTLGFIAALVCFIPYVGPILAAVPAVLVALAEGGQMVLYVVIVYWIVQVLESQLITPLIDQRAVSLPPALLIIGQMLMGVLAGILGIFLATPLAVVVVLLVQMLYVEDVLGDEVKVIGNGKR